MQERSLLDLWLVLYTRRYSIVTIVLSAVTAAIIGSRLVAPVYEARATFFVPAETPEIAYLAEGSAGALAQSLGRPITMSDLYAPYLGILKSVRLAKAVQERFPAKRLVNLLRADVDFELSDENILSVYVRDSNAEQAAGLANAYVAELEQLLTTILPSAGERQAEFLATTVDEVQAELDAAIEGLRTLEEQYGIVELNRELEALAEEKVELQAGLDDVEIQVDANASERAALEAQIAREDSALSNNKFTVTTPVIERLRAQLVDVTVAQSELETELGPNNPEIIALTASRREIEAQLTREISNWLNSIIKPTASHLEQLRQRLVAVVVSQQRLQATAEGYRLTINRVDERLRRYPQIKAAYERQREQVDQLRRLQRQLESNLREATLQSRRDGIGQVVVLDAATPPGRPVFPIWWLNALVALLGGSVVGVLYAFLLDYMARTRETRLRRILATITDNLE